jgi:hypothetical protein
VALVLAISVAAVVLVVSTGTMTVVMGTASTVSAHLAQVAAAEAAASGLAQAEQTVQAAIAAGNPELPCAVAGSAPGGSLPEAYEVAITYYQQLQGTTPSGPLACSNGEAPNQPIGAVAFSASGQGGGATGQLGATETIFSLDQVQESFAGGYGVYVNAGTTFDNQFTTQSTFGTVFVNGPVQCDNATDLEGNLVANGTVAMTNACTIQGTLTANGNVSVSTSSPVLDGLASVVGDLTFSNPGSPEPQFRGGAVVKGTASTTDGQPITTNVAGTLEQDAVVAFPSPPPFPQVTWDPAAWQAAGYQVVTYTDTSNCGSYYGLPSGGGAPSNTSGVYTDFFAADQLTAPEVLYTTCPLDLYGQVTMQIGAPFAIVDPAGFDFSNQTTFESLTSNPERLELIVPSCSSGCGGQLAFSNQTTFGTTSNPLQTLLYTPNEASFSNELSLSGQVVVGSTGALQNQILFNLEPFLDVPGTTNPVVQLSPVERYVASG